MKSQNQTLQPQKNNKEDLIDHSIFPLCLMGKQAQFNLEPNTPIRSEERRVGKECLE